LIINGVRLHCTARGAGKPVVLVHGLGGPLMWKQLTPLLEKDFRVVVIDLPGFGQSAKPAASYTIEYFTRFLKAILRELKIERSILVGVSLGGRISAELALASSNSVERLVLISSTGLSGSAPALRRQVLWTAFRFVADKLVLRSPTLICKLAERSFYDLSSRPADLCAEMFEQMSEPGGREAWLASFRTTITRDAMFATRLPSLSIPTLVVWGERDRAVPIENAYAFCRLIPNSWLVFLPACAHSVPLEKPHELARAIRTFVT